MKKLSILLLSMATFPAYSQGILNSLSKYQESLEPKVVQRTSDGGSSTTVGSTTKPVPEVKPGGGTSSTINAKCDENDQTSLPLNFVTSLILEKDGKLDLVHNPREGTLAVTSPDMIGNCSSMLEWKLKQPELQGKKAYAIEVKIKNSGECTSDAGCKYKVAKVKDGEFQQYEDMTFKPTMKGFEECLQKSGVVVDGKVVPGAIYSAPANEKFTGLDQSGRVLFLSHGPSTPMIKAKYGKFEAVDRCDYYELAHPQIKNVLTFADEERERLDSEAAKLKDCPINEYYKVADFLEKYDSYAAQLGEVRDRLILESAKKSAEAILAGKYKEEDLKVLADFDRYVVQPKIELAKALYNEMMELEGDAKKAKQEELKAVLSQITSLKQKPYFTGQHTKKLIADGRFEEAEKLNTILLGLDNYTRLGAKQDNVVITPAVAHSRIQSARAEFKAQLAVEKENYEIRTGQTSGKGTYYSQLANRMRQNIQVRTQNFRAEMQAEYERIQQPNGYCFKYWRNTQKCYQETIERLQELQALLEHYNKVDLERAAEYDAKAKEYGEMEAQGRRYIAAQNGEAVEEPANKPAQPTDTTVPTPRAQTMEAPPAGFQNPAQAQQQAQMMPQQYQQPVNPYAQNNIFQQQVNPYAPYMSQQQPQQYMGNQSYGNFGYQAQGNFQLGWGQAQQQYGYQQQQAVNPYSPYMQYNQYSMYRR